MRVSYHWLKTFFNEELPDPQKIAELLLFHSFEVESVAPEGDDRIFEIAILPNRRHDCLSHRGIAREISVQTGIPLSRDPFRDEVPAWNTPSTLIAEINTKGAPRYMAALLHGVGVHESPDWLKERLRAIGQKPISNIVDAMNYVMFDLGQPLHAFDAEKLRKSEGDTINISVRNAKKRERITVLGGAEYALEESDVIITDGVCDSPIGIAGVKGGTACEITAKTKKIIIESANFDPARVRATAMRLGLRTDASLRFESGLAPKQTEFALREVITLIEKLTGAELLGVCDIGKWEKGETAIPLSPDEVNKLLGTDINAGVLLDVLGELKFSYTKDGERVSVTPPFERLDVETKEDLIEEVGRVYGYERIRALPLPKADISPIVNKNFYYAEKIRDILVGLGYSEVYTHAIGTKGESELENPLAEDKRFLRATLHNLQFLDALHLNTTNRERLELESTKIFEIGKVFSKNGEHWELAIGGNSVKEDTGALFGLLNVPIPNTEILESNLVSYNLDEIFSQLKEPTIYAPYQKPEIEPRYRPFSHYPFVLRDIAVFVTEGTESDAVRDMIKNEAGKLLVGVRLFDEFRKDGKISYAFRLVFQSHEKTLSDEEVNEIMAKVTHALNSQEGFAVR